MSPRSVHLPLAGGLRKYFDDRLRAMEPERVSIDAPGRYLRQLFEDGPQVRDIALLETTVSATDEASSETADLRFRADIAAGPPHSVPVDERSLPSVGGGV